MNLEVEDEPKQERAEETNQLLNVMLAQGGVELLHDWAYLDGCSMVTVFKSNKYLKGIEILEQGVKINCNAGVVTTKQRGTYGGLKVWYLPNGIANIISMNELEELYCITSNS